MTSILLNKSITFFAPVAVLISSSSCINTRHIETNRTFETRKSESNSISSKSQLGTDSKSTSEQDSTDILSKSSSQSLVKNFVFSSPEKIESWRKLRIKGDEARNTGDHQKAVRDYTDALAIRPEHKTYFNRAISFTALGQLENALSDYNKSLELQQNFHEGWYNRGTLLARMQKHKEAISSYDKVISLQPENFSAWYNRGYSQGCLARYEDAILSNEKALSINPDLHLAWNAHGTNLVGLGRNKDAIASFQKALSIDLNNQTYKQNIDVVMSHLNTRIQMRPCSLTIFE